MEKPVRFGTTVLLLSKVQCVSIEQIRGVDNVLSGYAVIAITEGHRIEVAAHYGTSDEAWVEAFKSYNLVVDAWTQSVETAAVEPEQPYDELPQGPQQLWERFQAFIDAQIARLRVY